MLLLLMSATRRRPRHSAFKLMMATTMMIIIIIIMASAAASTAHASGAAHREEGASVVVSQQRKESSMRGGIEQEPQFARSEGLKVGERHQEVHKLMSEQDLRRTFQVDSHDQVPEYEILKFTVEHAQEGGSQLISPSSESWPASGPIAALEEQPGAALESAPQTAQQQQQQQRRHPQAGARSRRDTSATNAKAAAGQQSGGGERRARSNEARAANDERELNEIVMKLSTFGKDFKLRLKRNVDFQQRIKDMKMFMAESTKDGQLRYTEIKSHNDNANNQHNDQQQQQQQQHQEPHKRAALAASASDKAQEQQQQKVLLKEKEKEKEKHKEKEKEKEGSAARKKGDGVWNIGSTYHDEDNLAALLIDHDRRTGELRVDGTIGNDFVIKPMPQAAIDALLVKQQQQQSLKSRADQAAQSSSAGANNGNNAQDAAARQQPAGQAQAPPDSSLAAPAPSAGNLDLARTSATSGPANRSSQQQQQQQQQQNQADGMERALHMHEDDPHDDDEMFLDEDEAIELAHLQSAAASLGDSNHTRAATNESTIIAEQQLAALAAAHRASHLAQLPQASQPRSGEQQSARAPLSKAASERKWKKYRKLVAQTQVPKPAALARQQLASADSTTIAAGASSSQQQQQQQQQAARARRHAHPASSEPSGERFRISHHIVYRQKPSAEGSSGEHQHSFLAAPGNMEQLAEGLWAQRLSKRSAAEDQENMIDEASSSARRRSTGAHTSDDQEADFLSDPLGGQFYLEPGSVTGFERAGYSDWSLVGSAGRHPRAPPPYALNGTASEAQQAYYTQNAFNETSATRDHSNSTSTRYANKRFKRHAHRHAASSSGHRRPKRQAPDTVWPEVLLVVDYDSFLLHGGDSRDVKRYFVSFWNGVDLRYKLLVHPHIRISLAGMIVAKDRDATPYLERNRLRAPNADAVDAAGALTDMGKYLYREDRLPTYDLAVVITKLDMCRRRYEGGRCNRGTAGFAYVGGACVVNKRLEKVNSVAIIEDSGGFSGIIVAAHEVGHLLGCVHDGSPPPSYLGGPGATHCPWEDGFIMSDLRHTERGFRWSQCSVEQFKHFLNGETATCLYNYPHEAQSLHRLLPGTMLSLDEQCKRDRGTNACFKDARVCAQLFCFDSASGYCVSYRPAAEGSPCGEGQVCRNGKCVGEIENIIPDYSHQSQSIVARGSRPSAASATHAVSGRLADNGLSASSTSTATSSPDKALPPVAAAQLTSRMDTFPIDVPLSGPSQANANGYTSASQFGGRYSPLSSASPVDHLTGSNGLMLVRQHQQPHLASTQSAYSGNHHAPTAMKSAKLLDYGASPTPLNNNNNNNKHNYQQRSGHQAIPKGANQNLHAANLSKQYNNQPHHSTSSHYHHHNSRQPHYVSSSTASAIAPGLASSASTVSHQYPISSSSSVNGNSYNLLTSSSSVSTNTNSYPLNGGIHNGNSNKKSYQPQFYDNQRVLFVQPAVNKQQETQTASFNVNNDDNNFVNSNRNRNFLV